MLKFAEVMCCLASIAIYPSKNWRKFNLIMYCQIYLNGEKVLLIIVSSIQIHIVCLHIINKKSVAIYFLNYELEYLLAVS